MTTTILSPRLDDAVLSTYTVLAADDDVRVVNVFTGEPPEGVLNVWDRLCGATSGAEQARERLREDQAVMDALGAETTSLGLLDYLNRQEAGQQLDSEALQAAIRIAVAGSERVLAPLGGGPRPHGDHEAVRDAALTLPVRIELYADQPYVYKSRAWPTFVGGPGPDAAWWGKTAARLGERVFVHAPTAVTVLGDDARAGKATAMRGYRTQFDALNRKLRTRGLLNDPDLYGVEVRWETL